MRKSIFQGKEEGKGYMPNLFRTSHTSELMQQKQSSKGDIREWVKQNRIDGDEFGLQKSFKIRDSRKSSFGKNSLLYKSLDKEHFDRTYDKRNSREGSKPLEFKTMSHNFIADKPEKDSIYKTQMTRTMDNSKATWHQKKTETTFLLFGDEGDDFSGPAPNAYNVTNGDISDRLGKTPGITFKGKHSKLMDTSLETPGPAAYEPEPITQKKRQYAYSIGKSKRDLSSMLDKPKAGPGDYNIDMPNRIKGTILFNNIKARSVSREGPGPGAYDIDRSLQGSKYPFGTAKRQESIGEKSSETVGPLSYRPNFDTVLKRIMGIKFSKEKRNASQHDLSTPGVGKYEVPRDGLNTKTGIKFEQARRFLRKLHHVTDR